jgi:hypothetical protein
MKEAIEYATQIGLKKLGLGLDATNKEIYQRTQVIRYAPIIVDAARREGLPAVLVAQIFASEEGGSPPLLDHLSYGRHLADTPLGNPLGDPLTASFGPGLQLKQVAKLLGYNPAKITNEQVEAIIKTLEDPRQSIQVVAKYLAATRDIYFPGANANVKPFTEEQLLVIGNSYNNGIWNTVKNRRFTQAELKSFNAGRFVVVPGLQQQTRSDINNGLGSYGRPLLP